MTAAKTGMHKALARAGSSVLAIAEMQTESLLAELTDDQKAELSAALTSANASDEAAAKPKKGGDGDDADDEGGDGETEVNPTSAATASLIEPEALQTNASIHERVKAVATAVASDDGCKGKAGVALAMLADDDYASLSASGIIKIVAGAGASGGGEDDALAAMQAALATNTNSNIAANTTASGTAGNTAAKADMWDRAYASLSPKSAG